MSSRLVDMRTALVLAAQGLVPSTVEVLASGSTRACLNRISRRKSVFVVYGGWLAEGTQYAAARSRVGTDTWYLVVVVESYRSAEDAFAGAGNADEILEALLALSGTKIGGVSYPTASVWLTGVELTEGEVEGIEEGGTWGYVATFKTNPYKV